MALIYSTDFESEGALGEIFDNQVGTTAAFDATHVKTGSRALLIHQTGTANSSKRNLAAGTRSMTIRVWFWLLANPTAVWQLFVANQSGGVSTVIRISTGGTVQGGIAGGGFNSSSVISLGAWHSVDARIDSTGTTFTMDWQVDNIPQTQASFAGQVPADITNFSFGASGATNLDCWVDSFQLATLSGDYPLQDLTTTYTATFPAISPAPQVVVPVTVGTPRSKERALAQARRDMHLSADQPNPTVSGSGPYTVTFPALGTVPQVAIPLTALSRQRAIAGARQAFHFSANQSPIAVV